MDGKMPANQEQVVNRTAAAGSDPFIFRAQDDAVMQASGLPLSDRTPATPDDPAASVAALADGIGNTLRMARALAEAKRPIDLTGLDNLIGILCARMLDLPLDQGRALRDRLAAIDTEISDLAGFITPA